MKKFMFVICMMIVSIPALAYEPQVFHKDSPVYSHFVQSITQYMWYSSDDLNRIQEVTAKRSLSGCLLDKMANESLKHFKPNSQEHNDYLINAARDIRHYINMGPIQRDTQLDPKILEWVLNFEYQCLDYHLDPEYVLNQIAYLEANEEFEATCDQNDQECYTRLIKKYKEALGVE